MRERPSCRGRSTVGPVFVELFEQLFHGSDRQARRRLVGYDLGWSDPSLPNGLRKGRIVGEGAPHSLTEWDQLCNHAILVRDENGLPLLCQVDVLADLSLQRLQGNRSHARTVARHPHAVKSSTPLTPQGVSRKSFRNRLPGQA